MITSGSWEISWESSYWSTAANKKYYHWKGSWSRSGNTVTLKNMQLWLSFTQSSSGSGTDSVTVTGGSAQSVKLTAAGTVTNIASLNNTSFTVGTNDVTKTITCAIAGEQTGSTNLTFYTPPEGLSVSVKSKSATGAVFTVGITSWGNDSGATWSPDRYFEAGILNHAAPYSAPYMFTLGTKNVTAPASQDITVTNASHGGASGLTSIKSNTEYYYGAWAENKATYVSTVKGTFVTLAPALTAKSAAAASTTSIKVSYTTAADGGKYSKNIQYQIGSGSWTTGATVSSASSTSGNFTITGLNPGTTYTINLRVNTSSGSTSSGSVSATTSHSVPATPTISGSYPSSTYNDITYGTTSFGSVGSGTVYLYGGTSTAPTTQISSKTTTGNSTYQHSSLARNTRYYYRARAKSSAGWSSYSSEISGVTRAGAQAWSVSNYGINSITISYTTSSGGGVYAQEMQYSIDGGTTWTTGATVAAGTTASKTGTFTISGLTSGNTYTIQTRVKTTAGTAVGTTLTQKTAVAPSGLTVSISSSTWNTVTLSGSLSSYGYPDSGKSFAIGVSGAYGDYTYCREIGEKNATSLSGTLTNSSSDAGRSPLTLCGGKAVYAYAWAQNSKASYGWFPTGTAYYLPPAPLAQVNVQTQTFDSISQAVAISLFVKGGATDGTKNVSGLKVETQYRFKVHSSSSWGSWTTYKDSDDVSQFYADTGLSIPILGFTPNTDYDIEVRQVYSSKASEVKSITFTTIDRQIEAVNYSVELWSWSQNKCIFDLSPYIIGNLNMEWTLNDIEEVSFEMDALSFEADWGKLGSTDPLLPYAYDIKIRRNGVYIMGCNLVQVQYKIQNNPPSTMIVKATGYLNLFKDQYIMSEAWSHYTYGQIARKLVQAAQAPDYIIKNPTFDIDTSYWLAADGTLSYSTSSHDGGGCAYCSSTSTVCSIGTQMAIEAGASVSFDLWVKTPNCTSIQVQFRDYITNTADGHTISVKSVDTSGSLNTWVHITGSYTSKVSYENGYFVIRGSGASSNAAMYVDTVYVWHTDKEASGLNDHRVTLGTDTASSGQTVDRQVNYELQNVKDGIINLSNQGEDNFDFDFSPQRVFNIYDRKGSDKLNLLVEYPGNVRSVNIIRDASNLANKVVGIGSGIGDERLQIELPNNPSRRAYGTHESIITNNNISLKSSLISKTVGDLYDRKNPVLLPKVVVEDGSINPGNVGVGDSVPLRIENLTSFGEVNDLFRIEKIKAVVTPEMVEQMTLTLMEPKQRPGSFMVRYIKDIMYGNSVNNGNHWVQVRALMLVGNEYKNIALNKTVTATSGGSNLSRVTNGNMSASDYASTSSGQGVIIDLGGLYPIDYIQIWHYWPDGRRYYGEQLSVGPTLTSGITPLAQTLVSYGQTTLGYTETADGRKFKWVQENNIINGGTAV